jgi:hypothetical protein
MGLYNIESVDRLFLTIVLFPAAGHISPLVATNAVYLLGVSYGYFKLGRARLKKVRTTNQPDML